MGFMMVSFGSKRDLSTPTVNGPGRVRYRSFYHVQAGAPGVS